MCQAVDDEVFHEEQAGQRIAETGQCPGVQRVDQGRVVLQGGRVEVMQGDLEYEYPNTIL